MFIYCSQLISPLQTKFEQAVFELAGGWLVGMSVAKIMEPTTSTVFMDLSETRCAASIVDLPEILFTSLVPGV